MMDDNFHQTEDGTVIVVTAGLPDQQQYVPEWLRTLEETYSQIAGVPLPAREAMKQHADLLFINPRTKQMLGMNAADALVLYRLLDLYKEGLDEIVYEHLERDNANNQ